MAITTSYSWIKGTTSLLNNVLSAGSQFGPAVAGNPAGDRYFAAWSDPGSSYQVEGRVFDAGQNPLMSEFTVNNTANAGTVQFDSSVTALTNGNFLVVYRSGWAKTQSLRLSAGAPKRMTSCHDWNLAIPLISWA